MASLDVPKDGRRNAESSLTSAPAARSQTAVLGRLCFGAFALDLERGCLTRGQREIALRPKTFEVLCHLATNPRRLVSKDELMAAVWPNVVVTEDSLVQCVAELRRALDDPERRLIRTISRRGYRFEPTPRSDARGGAGVGPFARLRRGARRTRGAWPGLALLLAATLGAAGWWSFGGRAPAPAPPLSIAVLPFKALGADADRAHLAEGVTQDLTGDLSRLPGLFVIAHATARTFRGDELDVRNVGRELNVRYVLDGSVWHAGDTVRINAELVSSETGAALWAGRFGSTRDQLAASRNEIVGRIATTLNFRLTRLESERILREGRDDPAASDLTTRGWALVYAGKQPENYAAARELFAQALEQDPGAVNALAGVGWTSAIMVLDGWSASPPDDIAVAEAAVAKALDIDRNHVVANHVRGFLFRLARRSSAARDSFRTVVALNPNFAPAHAQLAIAELELGRPAAVRPAVEKAMRLSPRDPSLGPWLAFLGMAELHLGNDRDAVVWLDRAIDTGTPVALHQAYLASALALSGRIEEARDALAAFRTARPSATIRSLRAGGRSTEPAFAAQQERLFHGLRLAGLPD